MMRLKINPLVVEDLQNIKNHIFEYQNEDKAAETIKGICESFEYIQKNPAAGYDLSKIVNFIIDFQGICWEEYIIIYKIMNDIVEIYRVDNAYYY